MFATLGSGEIMLLTSVIHFVNKTNIACTVGIAAGLCGLPVHGSLDGFLPTGKAELALCL